MPVRRTLPPLLFSFILGIVFARLDTLFQNITLLFAAASLLLVITVLLVKYGRNSILVPLLLFLLLGLISLRVSAPKIRGQKFLARLYDRQDVVWTGEVASYPEFKRYGARFTVSVQNAQVGNLKYPITGLVQINVRKLTKQWYPGMKIVASFVLKDFRNFRTPGVFDYKHYMQRKGYIGKSYVASDKLFIPLKPGIGSWRKIISKIRAHSFDFLMKNVNRPANSIFAALLLGMKKAIPDYVREAFNLVGVSHLLAISGLHLGLLGGILYFLFSYIFSSWEWALLKFGKNRLVLLCTVPFVIFYAEVTGLSLPTKRAMLMVLIALLALLIRRIRDFWQVLSIAAMLILVDQPDALFQPSFQLSFSALIAIVFLTPRLKSITKLEDHEISSRFFRMLFNAFWVSLSACIGVAPLLAYHFRIVSLLGAIANLVIIPLVGFVALPCGLLSMAASFADPGLASAIIWPGTKALKLTLAIILKLSHLKLGVIYFPDFSASFVFLSYALIFSLFHNFSLNKKAVACGVIITTGLLLAHLGNKETDSQPTNTLTMSILDVGHGCCILGRFPTGQRMLIEGGNYSWSTFNIGKNVVAPFLWKEKVKEIDFLLLASVYPRCSLLPFVVDAFQIRELWHSGIGLRGYAFRETFESLREKNCTKKILTDFQNIRLGEVSLKVLYPSVYQVHQAPDPPYYEKYYVIFSLKYGKTRIVLLPFHFFFENEELRFHESQSAKTALLFYGKTTGKNSVDYAIKLSNPEIVVFIPEVPKSYHHETAQKVGIKWFSISKDGLIRIVSDGNEISVQKSP